MNKVVTSKDEILHRSQELIRERGLSAISIRSVAAACGVSVGSVYNYFDSKAELVSPEDGDVFRDVHTCVVWMYERMAYGGRQYPSFFTLHSIGFMREEKDDGKRRMHQVWQHILDVLCSVMKQDTKIREDAFTEQLTVEQFAQVLFSQILSALLRQDYDPTAVLEIVRRTLY
mgnify:CR=1 FL=1